MNEGKRKPPGVEDSYSLQLLMRTHITEELDAET